MKYILLDLGGVLFESTGRSSQKIHWEIISRLNKRYGHRLNLGEDLYGTFLDEYNQLTEQHLEGGEFLKEIFDTLSFNQGLIDLLQPYAICILSDNYRENIAYISQRYAFSSWADRQFYSYDFGKTKSDPTLFKELMIRLGTAPEDVFLIDDDPTNIQTAASCGIKGICYKRNEQVKSWIHGTTS